MIKFIDNYYKLFQGAYRVGLDIGAGSAKVVRVRNEWGVPVLKRAEQCEWPFALRGDLTEERLSEAGTILSELWQEKKIKTRKVSLTISDPDVYLRHIRIPRVAENELVKAIKWQVEKFVPFPVEEASVDFFIVESGARNTDNEMEIVIFAAEKKVIDKYMTIMERAQLSPEMIGVSPVSVARLFSGQEAGKKKEMVSVIDIGCQKTSIVILDSGTFKFVRNIEWSSGHMVRVISQKLGINPQAAGKILNEFILRSQDGTAEGRNNNLSEAIECVLGELVEQINLSWAYYEREVMVEGIDRVVLCGGGSQLRGLDIFLREKLELPADKISVNDFKAVTISPDLARGLSGKLPEYAGALGAVV